MSTKWNLAEVRKVAGLPLTEAWHDNDDDEDPDVKIASGDKRQKEFESRNKKHLDDNAEMLKKRTAEQKAAAAKKKEEAKAAPKPAEKKEEPKPAAKAEEKKPAPAPAEKKAEEKKPEPAKAEEKKPEEKKEETPAAAEAKRRGAKPNANSKSQRAAAWIKSNPNGTRGQFLAWAKANLDMGSAYGSAFFARHNPKSKRQAATEQKNECYVLTHPLMPSFLLAENREMNQMQWVDSTSPLEPVICETEAEANKIAKYMSEWKGQQSTIVKIVFED